MSKLELITTDQVLEVLGVSRTTFETIRRQHGFPEPYALTSKCYRYSLEEINRWVVKRKTHSSKKQVDSELIKQIAKSKKIDKSTQKLPFELFKMVNGGRNHATARPI